jgi:septal ring factor EnvC (AmiA/AmiB activator)
VRRAFFLLALFAISPAAARTHRLVLPQFAHPGDRVDTIVPTRRPDLEEVKPEAGERAIDLSHALPAKALAKLPSSAEQLKTLTAKLKQGVPQLSAARQKSDSLAAQAAALKKQLIDTAARIEDLERRAAADAAEIDRLTALDARLSAGFVRDRVSVTHLLALLERLQHDMPPALVMRPDDALGAARGAMLVGASLPPLYAKAVALSRRIDALERTRKELAARHAQARATADKLARARGKLDRLLAVKQAEAEGAADRYGNLRSRMEKIALQATDFQTLQGRIAAMRRGDTGRSAAGIVTVTGARADEGGPARGSLLVPVVGTAVPGGQTPGLTFATRAGAQVIAPADGKVLFAGPYHKSGQVLILEITTGYDLVLAGLGRVTVKLNDQLLAGEPIGNMPAASGGRLYFELRKHGHGLNPAPWLGVELRKASKT